MRCGCVLRPDPLLCFLGPSWDFKVKILKNERECDMGFIDFFREKIAQRTSSRNPGIQDRDSWSDVRDTQTAILSFTLVGLFALLLFTFTSASPFSWTACLRLTGIGLLYAGAFFGVGALAGFLFGIPRSLQNKSKNRDKSSESGEMGQPKYAANTNLEEISDWLTKIIVGLGLVNLKSVPELLKKTASYFAGSCGKDVCEAVAMGVMIYFSVCGFFLGYLMTRLYLAGAFTRAEKEETVEPFETLQEPITVPIEVSPGKTEGQ